MAFNSLRQSTVNFLGAWVSRVTQGFRLWLGKMSWWRSLGAVVWISLSFTIGQNLWSTIACWSSWQVTTRSGFISPMNWSTRESPRTVGRSPLFPREWITLDTILTDQLVTKKSKYFTWEYFAQLHDKMFWKLTRMDMLSFPSCWPYWTTLHEFSIIALISILPQLNFNCLWFWTN